MAHLSPTPGRPRVKARPRVIPVLTMDARGQLVKTIKFNKRRYIGDPINAVKVFNRKEVDEILLLDIDATIQGKAPRYSYIRDIVSEAYMPVAYGGGLRSLTEVERVFDTGVEKIILSSSLAENFNLIGDVSERWGSQAVAVCLPVARPRLWGAPRVRLFGGSKALTGDVAQVAQRAAQQGAGELIVYAIDRDGTYDGYDDHILSVVAEAVDIPVVACGGGSNLDGLVKTVAKSGCAAVAAGSLFVFRANGQGVLINYPSRTVLQTKFEGALDG